MIAHFGLRLATGLFMGGILTLGSACTSVAGAPSKLDAELEQAQLPLSADAPGKSVDAQRADPASLLALYRRLLALRRARPALHAGTYAPLDRTPEHVFAFTRTDGADRVLVALNFGDASAQLALPAPARMLLSTDNGARLVGCTLHLPPRAGAVLDP